MKKPNKPKKPGGAIEMDNYIRDILDHYLAYITFKTVDYDNILRYVTEKLNGNQ